MTKLAYGLVALAALTTFALAPSAAADPIIEVRSPSVGGADDVTVRVDLDGPCLLYVWVDNTGGIHCLRLPPVNYPNLPPPSDDPPITVIDECGPLTTSPRICHGVTVRVDLDGPCLLYVWIDNRGGIHCFP
jgi:hypothetical protein